MPADHRLGRPAEVHSLSPWARGLDLPAGGYGCPAMAVLDDFPGLAADLAACVGKEGVISSPDVLSAYECDGFAIHKGRPVAVALPRTTQEAAAVVRACLAAGIAIVPRGAGTCLSGGPTPVGPAVVLDTGQLRRILAVHPEDLVAVVQPGVANLALTKHAAQHGLHYAPDPSSQPVCTLGGNVAENSGGPHCFKYGMTTDYVLGITAVLGDGSVVEMGGEAGPRAAGGLDLAGAFTGSEGTFGIATELVVRLTPTQPALRTMLGSFETMGAACRTVSAIVAAGLVPAAMEIMDQATIRAVEASVFAAGYPSEAAAVLLVELDGHPDDLAAEGDQIRAHFLANDPLSFEEADDPEARARLWKGRKGAFGAMGRLRPDLYVIDGVVPRPHLETALERIAAVGARHGFEIINFFHAGDGNVHPNISFDGRDAEEVARVEACGHDILAVCTELGGSISGEHGIGTEKLDHVHLMFGDADLEVMDRLRAAFDPHGLCNPGKVLPDRSIKHRRVPEAARG